MDSQERKAACARCGTICVIRRPVERIKTGHITLNAATADRGLCRECATHWWLYAVDGFRWSLSEFGPGVLTFVPAQEALARVLGMMHPELAGVDWNKVRAQWDLPWPADWALPKEGINA